MKRMLGVALAVVLVLAVRGAMAAAEPLADELAQWASDFKEDFLHTDPAAPRPIVPVPGWPAYAGAGWSIQYPRQWQVVDGNPYFVTCSDADKQAGYAFVQVQRFDAALDFDQLAQAILSQVVDVSTVAVVDSFEKNMLPQLGLAPPNGISRVYLLRADTPQAGRVFSVLQITVLAYLDAPPAASTSVTWTLMSAPQDQFLSTWDAVFVPMQLSSSYVIPKEGGEQIDRDNDGFADGEDAYPDDPQRH